MSILSFHNLSQFFGAVDIFTGLTASIAHRQKIGLIGPNGIGKTTLLRILAGRALPKHGQCHLAKGATVGYLHQEAVMAFADQNNTVFEEMLSVYAHLEQMAVQLHEMEQRLSRNEFSDELLNRYGLVQEVFEQAGGYDYDVRIRQVLTGLGFAAEQWNMPLAHCSGGQKTRVLLARLLLEEPDLLILDEPTNHLDVTAVEWLENRLRSWPGTLLIVSHDRFFLDTVVSHIWEMSRNGIEIYRGNYSAYWQQRAERWQQREEAFTAVQERFLRKLDFIKRNIARASASDRAKGELKRLVRELKAVEVGGAQALNQDWARFMSEQGISKEKWSVAEVQRHIKGLENPNPASRQPKMTLQMSARSGAVVLRSKGLWVGYPDKPLFEVDDFVLQRQEVVALIGPNGSGKSTFLKLLLGEIEPLDGRVRFGHGVQISYFAQAHETLNPQNSILEELLSVRNIGIHAARNHLAHYLFRDDTVYQPVTALSGGERGRLALAKLALLDANFLLLDEPTNHLDIPAQEILQDALQSFPGTILLVSHDRFLIDNLATQIWEIDDGRLHIYDGGYQSYLAAKSNRQQEMALAL